MTRLTAWKAVRPDLRTSNGYRWPWPGSEAVADPGERGFTRGGNGCPAFPGDGLCLAKTWAGAASGGIPAITCLLVTYDPADVLAETDDKLRVTRCRVTDVYDAPALIRAGFCAGADLRGADLGGADLGGADLGGAYLGGAYLRGADLRGADLGGAYLGAAYLRGADLGGAYLGAAYLGGAYLGGADLGGADLGAAYLGGAYLGGAYLGGADLGGAYGRDDWDALTRRGAIR